MPCLYHSALQTRACDWIFPHTKNKIKPCTENQLSGRKNCSLPFSLIRHFSVCNNYLFPANGKFNHMRYACNLQGNNPETGLPTNSSAFVRTGINSLISSLKGIFFGMELLSSSSGVLLSSPAAFWLAPSHLYCFTKQYVACRHFWLGVPCSSLLCFLVHLQLLIWRQSNQWQVWAVWKQLTDCSDDGARPKSEAL